MEGTDYLHLTVAALYQLRDSVVAAQGYLEIAQATQNNTNKQAIKACRDAIERAGSLLTALEAYRVHMNTDMQSSSVRLDRYLQNLAELPTGASGPNYYFERTYRLPTVTANPQLLDYVLMLISEYVSQLDCRRVEIITRAKTQDVVVMFVPSDCQQVMQYPIVNKKLVRASELSRLDHPTLLLVTAKLLAAKMSANLHVSSAKISLTFPRARQLKMEIPA